jgi:serine/threonine protein kinase
MNPEPAGDILIERFDAIACSNCSQPIDTAAAEPFSLVSCPSCGAEMRVPARFANFILIEQLGKGGMGAVYKAYDQTLGRTVAIKVTQQSIGEDRAFVEQFLQEARALAAINNPHIVQIYSYGEEAGQPYIVMELVDGARLDHLQEKKVALDEVFVLQTAIQVIRGLQAASAAGMTHGDIKPANILYDRSGNAKVADFGLARFSGEKPKPGEIWGTPYYVAPEVVKGQAPNEGSDIYSLGGTLYHVLTGEPPFNCETVVDTVLLRFKEPPPDPREFKKSVTPKTVAILMRMLEMDSFKRYPTYESLARDLSDALDQILESRSGKKNPPRKSAARRVVAILATLAVLVAAIAVGLPLYKQRQAERIQREKAAAQFDADKAAGKIKQVFRDGKLQWVRVEPAASPSASSSAPPSEWKLVATRDADVSGDNAISGRKGVMTLHLLAGNKAPIEKASKIYLRFSLDDVDRARIKDASLELVAVRRGNLKPRAPQYKLLVWVLKTAADWTELVTWKTAPGNDTSSLGSMNPNVATLLQTFDIPAQPDTGDQISVPLPALVPFLRNDSQSELTLVLTGDTATDHRSGWHFTATEDKRFRPPTLLLKAK